MFSADPLIQSLPLYRCMKSISEPTRGKLTSSALTAQLEGFFFRRRFFFFKPLCLVLISAPAFESLQHKLGTDPLCLTWFISTRIYVSEEAASLAEWWCPHLLVSVFFSGFLAQSQNLHVRLIGGSKWECVCRCGWWTPVSPVCLRQGWCIHRQCSEDY